MIFEVLTANQAAREWGSIGTWLAQAAAFDFEQRITLAGLYEEVLKGTSLVVVFRGDDKQLQGAAVVTATDIKTGKFLFVKVLGGNFDSDDWIVAANDHLTKMARAFGCSDGVMFFGRPGWVRKLKRVGYKEVQVIMVGGFDHGR